jgi:predicted DNA-binding transcriptional regulator YafY
MGAGAPDAGSEAGGSLRLARPLYSSHFPLTRLLQLVVLLQSERCPNARRLAEICEVSRRTIYRDLATLADAGIPVVYRADRQGYELARTLFLQPLRIEDREAAALLVLCRRWEEGDDLGLGDLAERALGKLIQSLPEGSRARLLNAAEVLSSACEFGSDPTDRRAIYEAILDAVADRKQVRVWTLDAGAGEPDSTKLAIYRLARIHGYWSLVGRSSRDARVITMPLHRVVRAEVTADESTIPPRFSLHRFLRSPDAVPELAGRASPG